MLNPLNDYSVFTTIPYGSDAFQLRWLLSGANMPPDYPDYRPTSPHNWLPSGINSEMVAGDEINGAGVNWPRTITQWDDGVVPHPTLVQKTGDQSGIAKENGQTVDIWIQREQNTVYVAREPQRRMQAEGQRGTP